MEPNVIERLFQVKNEKEKEDLLSLINQEKLKLSQMKNDDSLIRQAIIDFFLIYNPTNSEFKNEEIANFSKNLIALYKSGKDISSPILKLIEDNFKKPSAFKILKNFTKIQRNKAPIECCFKLLLLSKNIQNLICGLNNYLSINNEFLNNQLKKIDFESPYAQVLVRNLIENLILIESKLNDEGMMNLYEKQIESLNDYYKFLCPACLQFLFIRYTSEKYSVTCRNGHNYSGIVRSIEDLEKLKDFIIKCKSCNKKLELYESNFICFQCDKFFCGKCSELHKNECLKNVLCKIYKCSFACREHNKNFISFCSLCEKNLCESCKNVHFHRIPNKDYHGIKEIIDKNKVLISKEIKKTEPKKYILKELILSYLFFENYYMIPWFFRQSIYFSVNDNYLNVDNSGFFFDSFFDEEFIAYYSTLVSQMENGNMNSINVINNIKEEYLKKGKKINEKYNIKISSALSNAMTNSSRMIFHIFNLNRRFNLLNEIHIINELKFGHLSEVKKQVNKLETEICLYKAKILSLFKISDKYKEGLKLLFDRHFATLIIKILMKKFHSSFKKVNLDLEIAKDLINYYKKDSDCNKRAEIHQILKNEILFPNTNQIEEAKNDTIDITKVKNEIQFIKSVTQGYP